MYYWKSEAKEARHIVEELWGKWDNRGRKKWSKNTTK